MPIYKKEVSVPALSYKTVSFSLSASPRGERAVSGVLYPVKSLNFRASGEGMGVVAGPELLCAAQAFGGHAPAAVYVLSMAAGLGVVFFSQGKLYACTLTEADGTLSAPAELATGGITFAAPPQAAYFVDAAGGPALFFFAPEGCFVWDGEEFSAVTDAPAAATGCTYYERIFLVSSSVGYRVYFSAPLDETVWETAYRTAGYVDLAPEYGHIDALIPCGDKIVVLRERGASVLQAEGENSEFSCVSMPASFGRVFAGSAQAIGEEVVFLSSDGLYAHDGDKARRIADEWFFFAPPSADPQCISAVGGGEYILSYLTATGERRTLFYNPETERGFLSDVGLSAPVYGAEKGLLFSEAGLCRRTSDVGENRLTGLWESGYTLLGLGAGRKLLRRLTLFGKGKIKLTIQGEHARNKLVYAVCLGGQFSVLPLLRDTGFSLRLESEGGECLLRGLQAEGAALKGGMKGYGT